MVKNTIVYGYEGHIVIISSLNNTEVFNKFETIKIDNYDPKGHYSSKMDEIEALYTNSIYGARIDHFRHEKEILAYEVVDWIYDKYLLKNKSKICLLIDSGTTTYHVFREISKMINKYDEKKKRWKENVCIVTNNLPGSQYFMLNCRKSDDERSGTVLPCILLPGKTLSIYAAIASEETTAWISGKKKGRDTKSEMRKSLENEWKCGSHDYKIISIVSTNYVVCHKENGLERFLPVARGKEHFNVKREVIKAGDEVIIISPLMKFSFASVNLLNAVNKFTIPQVSDEADDNPSQVEYKEIFTEDKKVTWFITTRKKYEEGRKRIFGEFSEKLVNKLKEAYDNVQHFEFELEKDNYHKTLDFDRELELEIPHFALRNNYRGQNIWNEELIDAIEEMYFGKPEKQ